MIHSSFHCREQKALSAIRAFLIHSPITETRAPISVQRCASKLMRAWNVKSMFSSSRLLYGTRNSVDSHSDLKASSQKPLFSFLGMTSIHFLFSANAGASSEEKETKCHICSV